MTIIEALKLKDGELVRMSNFYNDKWFFWDGLKKKLIVCEEGNEGDAKIILETNNEEEAVSELLKG